MLLVTMPTNGMGTYPSKVDKLVREAKSDEQHVEANTKSEISGAAD